MKGMITENAVFINDTRLVLAFLDAEAPIRRDKLYKITARKRYTILHLVYQISETWILFSLSTLLYIHVYTNT